MKAISKVRKLLAEIIVKSADEEVDKLAGDAIAILNDEDARTSSRKPTKR